MTRRVRLPLLVRRGRIWAAKVRVPKDVRPALGRSVFVRSTGEEDAAKAWVTAQPWIKAWKAEIDAARSGSPLAERQQIDLARAIFRDAEQGGRDLWKVVEGLLAQLGIRHPDHETKEGPKPTVPKAPVSIMEQVSRERMPFSASLRAWEAQLALDPRSARMFASDVRAFAKEHPNETVEGLESRTVQAWIDACATEGLAPKTIERKLSALRNYWGYLQAHEIAPEDRKPFHGRKVPNGNGKARVKRKHFTPAEVLLLHHKALGHGDQALADLIWLAAHTGARIEELCSLKVSHLHDNGSLTIPGTKTDAAERIVPIHTAIKDTVARLVADSKDGWLVPCEADNQYGERSAGIGKRFGRLKTQLGFGPAHVFHSIRKTVTTLLEDAGCPENVAADIVGHDKPTMTYGLYSGGSSLETRRMWLEKAVQYVQESHLPGYG